MKHTPGPWWKTLDKSPIQETCHDAHGCQVIATIGKWLIYSKDSVPHQINPQEARANARIISMAPEGALSGDAPLYLGRETLREIQDYVV